MNKFFIFVVLFIVVFCDDTTTEDDYLYSGAEGETCEALNYDDRNAYKKRTAKECLAVEIPDNNYKCCLTTYKVNGVPSGFCEPLKVSKVDDYIRYQNTNAQEITVDCEGKDGNTGNNDSSDSASNYLSKGLIILLSLLF